MSQTSLLPESAPQFTVVKSTYSDHEPIYTLYIRADSDLVNVHFPSEQAALAFAEKHNFSVEVRGHDKELAA